MFAQPRFAPGITSLITRHRPWIEGRRIGLVTHLAAMDRNGACSADLLASVPGLRLVSLFGPEHGFFGIAGAGESVAGRRHPGLNVPIHSLYGQHRKPTPAMFRGLEAVVVDLQDLGARCYTYVATLRCVLETAAGTGTTVIVTDRPIPLPNVVDGPMLDPRFGSFVASIPAPMSYGMTPAETALWLRTTLPQGLDLKVVPMSGYRRAPSRQPGWPPWLPPSPGIKSWESAQTYLATVFAEAFPALDFGRGTPLSFQVLGAPWIRSAELQAALVEQDLPGAMFHRHYYHSGADATSGHLVEGIRLTVVDANRFRPAATAVAIVSCIQSVCSRERLWRSPGVRPEFFDKLFGTDDVRLRLLDGESPSRIAAGWRRGTAGFRKAREANLLYEFC